MKSNSTIAVIGLGSMGYGIAQSLLRAENTTYGFDINAATTTKFQTEGGSTGSLKEIASTLDAVMVVVLNAAQTEAVLFGENGVVSLLKPGCVVISCATVAPDFARSMSDACEKFGVHYLDAPISGGSKKAASGELSVMASGTSDAFLTGILRGVAFFPTEGHTKLSFCFLHMSCIFS